MYNKSADVLLYYIIYNVLSEGKNKIKNVKCGS